MFSDLIGNSHIKAYLQKAYENDRIKGTFLFSGPAGVGKSLFAKALGFRLILGKSVSHLDQPSCNLSSEPKIFDETASKSCYEDPLASSVNSCLAKLKAGSHPDFQEYYPEGKIGMHSVDSMRKLISEVYQSPYEAKCKVFLIHNADRMLSYSANALLKTFEEPPKESVILLTTDSREHLLPTIRSRVKTLYFHQIPEKEIVAYLQKTFQLDEKRAAYFAKLSSGSLSYAVSLLNDEGSLKIRKWLLDGLSQKKFATYGRLREFSQEITTHVDELKSQYQEEASTLFLAGHTMEDLTSVQKGHLQKEIEAAVSMSFLRFAKSLIVDILCWYRDLHLLKSGSSRSYLCHPDFAEALLAISMEKEPLDLEFVQEITKEAELKIERSTPLAVVLENLFLKLNLL